jgi:hypothetical protein
MNGDMPPGWHIAIGRMDDASAAGIHWHRTIAMPIMGPNNEFLRAQSVVYCIEQAAFHCVGALGDNIFSLITYSIGISLRDWNTAFNLHTIWPVERILPFPSSIHGKAGLRAVQQAIVR